MITYSNERIIRPKELAEVFEKSGIHRPTDDLPRLEEMIAHADILWTAWEDKKLVGIVRALTDFSYACYLSDLAVDKDYQQAGIGKNLIDKLQKQIGPEVSLVLLAAAGAMDYYPKVGFDHADNAFLIPRRPF